MSALPTPNPDDLGSIPVQEVVDRNPAVGAGGSGSSPEQMWDLQQQQQTSFPIYQYGQLIGYVREWPHRRRRRCC